MDHTGPTKFEQYGDFSERGQTIPSHSYLAIRRGENEEAKKLAGVIGNLLANLLAEQAKLRR